MPYFRSQRLRLLAGVAIFVVGAASADQPTTPPTIVTPVRPGATEVLITDFDSDATLVTLYLVGGDSWSVEPQSSTMALIEVPPIPGAAELYATQTVAGIESNPSPTIVVTVPAPRIIEPVIPGDNAVLVTDIDPNASLVTIYLEDGNSVSAEPLYDSLALVAVGTLADGDEIYATQTVAGAESAPSPTVIVGVPPPTIIEPVVPGATEVFITHIDPNATLVTLYFEDDTSLSVIPQNGEPALIEVPALLGGAKLYATQTLADIESGPSDTVVATTPPPTLLKPTEAGALEATVTNIHPDASLVIIHDTERAIILGAAAPSGAGTITLELDFATVHCQTLAATQIIAAQESLFSKTLNTGGDSLGRVVINEFRHDDPGSDNEEFVELYNADSVDVNIAGWLLRQGGPNGDSDAADIGVTLGDVVLPAGGFYLISQDSLNPDQVISSNNFLRNDPAYLELVTACGEVVDTVAWARSGGSISVTTEDAIWGDLYSYTPLHGETLARWYDGYDTDSNRLDFGVRRPTPGASNNTTFEGNYHTTLDPLGEYSSQFFGQWRDALIIDPNQTGPTVDGDDWNPHAVAAPPTGGNAITFWDPDGGTNHYHSESIFIGAVFDVWMYFDTTKLKSGETIYWTVGLGGSAVNDAFNSVGGALAGETGVLWEYRRTSSSNKLTLFNASQGGGRVAWKSLGSVTLANSVYPSGWYRLALSADPNGLAVGVFDTQSFSGQANVGEFGGMYIVYDDDNYGGVPQARFKPPMIAGDVDCDDNGELDLADAVHGRVLDCNGDYLSDECIPPTFTFGDYNFDGLSDSEDWLFIDGCLTGPAPNALIVCCEAFDQDPNALLDPNDPNSSAGDVDLADFAALQLLPQ